MPANARKAAGDGAEILHADEHRRRKTASGLRHLCNFMRCRLQIVAWSALFCAFCSCGNSSTTHPDLSNPAYTSSPAIKAATQAIAADTANGRLYYDRGNLLLKADQDSLALKDFYKAISLDSARAEYYSAVGDVLFEGRDITASAKWLRQAISLNPKDPRAHLKLAKMMLFAKDYKAALTEINTVLRADVHNAEAYFLKGMVFKDGEDLDDAVSAFQTAVQVDPSYRDAYLQLGILAAAKNDSAALRYWENAYRLDSTDVFPLYARGKFYQDRSAPGRAKEEYRRAVARNRAYADAQFALGFLLLEDSTEAARRHFDLAAKADPRRADAVYNRGLAAEVLGDTRAAEADYRQALSLDPGYTNAQAGLRRVQQ